MFTCHTWAWSGFRGGWGVLGNIVKGRQKTNKLSWPKICGFLLIGKQETLFLKKILSSLVFASLQSQFQIFDRQGVPPPYAHLCCRTCANTNYPYSLGNLITPSTSLLHRATPAATPTLASTTRCSLTAPAPSPTGEPSSETPPPPSGAGAS